MVRRFRNHPPSLQNIEFTSSQILSFQLERLCAEIMQPEHFFVGPDLRLEWTHQHQEEIPWEIYKGQLLQTGQTKQQRVFESWSIYWVSDGVRAAEPMLSLKHDSEAGLLHITRAILCYAWEAYDAGSNVILSKECQKWVRELVGTVDLRDFEHETELRDELICRVFQAIVGTSRLPITSLEAPLPWFSLGQLAYFHVSHAPSPRPVKGPIGNGSDLIRLGMTQELSRSEQAKLLECILRATPTSALSHATTEFMVRWEQVAGHQAAKKRVECSAPRDSEDDILGLFRTMFNEVSLSPYTDLVDKTLVFLQEIEKTKHITLEGRIDFLVYLLCIQGRHLAAYDLVNFHNRGANYPDALLVDAVLKCYLRLAGENDWLFLDNSQDTQRDQRNKRWRRRALRHGWLTWHHYQGHPVPDTPTSQGENQRVLPGCQSRVPAEQILYPHRRTRSLYAGESLAGLLSPACRAILAQSIRDLRLSTELKELGLALFLERPFGAAKRPTEPDQTPLFSYFGFSQCLAQRRLTELAVKLNLIADARELGYLRNILSNQLPVAGLALDHIPDGNRPGTVCLADAKKSAEDFVFLATTRHSRESLFRFFDFSDLFDRYRLSDVRSDCPLLIVRENRLGGDEQVNLAIYDQRIRKRVEMWFDPKLGYFSRGGIELPRGPLVVSRIWEETGEATDALRFREIAPFQVAVREKSKG